MAKKKPETEKQEKIEDIKAEKDDKVGAMVGVRLMQKSGLFPDVVVNSDQEAYELVNSLEKEAENDLAGVDISNMAPLTEYEPGKYDEESGKTTYSIATKAEAIFLMEIIQRETDEGELVPRYVTVGNLLGIPRRTIRAWWDKREMIKKVSDGVSEKLGDIVLKKLEIEVLRMTVAMSKMNYDEMSAKDFFTAFKTVLMQYRILSGQSTANVAHDHVHRGTVEVIASDDME
jgi:hypothetical protein